MFQGGQRSETSYVQLDNASGDGPPITHGVYGESPIPVRMIVVVDSTRLSFDVERDIRA